MRQFKKSFALLMLLTVISASQVSAQDSLQTSARDYLNLTAILRSPEARDRAMEVKQDNEYVSTGTEQGIFYENPLMLDGKPLDYYAFNLGTKGELTLIKGAAITNRLTQVPFYVYLRRDGNKIPISGNQKCNVSRSKIEISEVLKHAEPGDLLVIEPVNKVDGPAKRILKLLGGC